MMGFAYNICCDQDTMGILQPMVHEPLAYGKLYLTLSAFGQ